ncbi:class I SAM-dependent methyltransferase [Nocardia thailandica]
MDETWGAEAARVYDTPGTGMFAPDLLDVTTDFLAELAGAGRALEFAVGTGRVAIPLAGRGVPATGIELAPAMVDRLRDKADELTVPVVLGDMTEIRVKGEFTLVYLVYNTISNVLTQDAQIACFRNAARHLAPGGHFVVELWVPDLRALPPGREAVVWRADADHLGLDTYDVVDQLVVSHHVRTDARGTTTLARSTHRYVWPAELDLMARLAGLTPCARYADWSRAPFTADSASHVSVYRAPDQ